MAEMIGFDRAIVAILDGNDQIVTDPDKGLGTNGLFTMDAKTSLGVLGAAFSGLAPTLTKVYGSNQLVDTVGKGTGDIKMTLTANDIPFDVMNKITGLTKDEATGGYYLDKNSTAPYCAFVAVSQTRDGSPLYLALYKGKFSPAEKNPQTNTNDPKIVTDSIAFSAIARASDGKAYGEYLQTSTTDQDKILADIFHGYAPKA